MPWFYYVVMGFTMLFGSPANLPLGVPPLPEDPVLAKVAPEECLWYMSWAGTARADATSGNETERLLAEHDVKRFVAALHAMAVDGAHKGAGDDPQAKLLADELPGLITTLLTRPTAIMYEKNVPDGRDGQQPVAAAIVNLGEQTEATSKSLLRLEKQLLGDDAPRVEIAGAKWHAVPLPKIGVPILWNIRGRYLILGLGKTSVEGILSRARTDPPKWLTDLKKQMPVQRVSLVNYYNVGAILKINAAKSDPQTRAILSAAGIDQLSTVRSVAGLDEQGHVSRTLYALDGEPRGVFALAGGKSLSRKDLAVIPRDVTFAAVARLDAHKALGRILKIVGEVDKDALAQAEAAIAGAEKALGRPFSQDLAALGDVWRVWSDGEGGMITLSVDVRDRQRVAALLAKLESKWVATARVGSNSSVHFDCDDPELKPVEVERTIKIRVEPMTRKFKFKGQTITFLNKTSARFMPVAPAWCLTEKQLIVSLFPQGIKAYLSRPEGSPSLADEPKVAAALRSGGTIGFTYLDTKQVAKQLYPVLQIMAQLGASQLQREGLTIDMSHFPAASAILPHLSSTVSSVERTEAGLMTVSRATLPVGGDVVTGPAASLALFVPAIQAVRAAARKNQSKVNLHNLGVAIHAYADQHKGKLPSGKKQPLLSWRVHLLVFFGEHDLHDAFHFDEPWDSKHNKKLIKHMPTFYVAPTSGVAAEGKTVYLAVTGKNTAFEKGANVGLEMPDGTSNTIMLVEANDERAVIWTKPDDWELDPKDPLAGLGGQYPGGFLALFADTAVRQIPLTSDKKKVKALMIRNDGISVDPTSLEPE